MPDPDATPYGGFDTVLDTLMPDIGPGHVMADCYSIAGVPRGTALAWAAQATIVPERPEIMDGIGRFQVRPAVQRRRERDEAPLAAR